jgi:hypothetical protein
MLPIFTMESENCLKIASGSDQYLLTVSAVEEPAMLLDHMAWSEPRMEALALDEGLEVGVVEDGGGVAVHGADVVVVAAFPRAHRAVLGRRHLEDAIDPVAEVLAPREPDRMGCYIRNRRYVMCINWWFWQRNWKVCWWFRQIRPGT